MSQYKYAKDNRSDSQYRRDFTRGTRDQQVALDQFVVEQLLAGHEVLAKLLADKTFQTDLGSWTYHPDALMQIDRDEFGLEIKVARNGFTDAVDLKAEQLEKLIKLDGRYLYATKQEYAFFPAQWVKDNFEVERSQRFGGKPVYSVPSDKLPWAWWTHNPTFN